MSDTITIIAQTRHVDLDGTIRGAATIASIDGYVVPTDPMDELHCDSCQ